MLKVISKLKAIWRIITEDEFFLMTASVDSTYNHYDLGPIKYNYETNTMREMFYVFLKTFAKDLEYEDFSK